MRFEGFIGPSYQAAAVQVDAQRTVNLYPELIAGDGGASETAILVRTPGRSLAQDIGAPGRGLYTTNGRLFTVAGTGLYEIVRSGTAGFYGYTPTLRGSVGANTDPVIMKSNGVQLLVNNGAGSLFAYTLRGGAFTGVAFMGVNWSSTALTIVDTYAITAASGSNQFFISAPLDGTSWSSLDFGSTQESDLAVTVDELRGVLWVFGNNRITHFQDTGNASFPFQRIPGTTIDMGIAAARSVAALDNTLYWLGANSRGTAVVYRADGFLPMRVSTHAMENALQNYATVSDATAYSYQENGHLFYRLDFPTAGATWVYDVATKAWHERGKWNAATNSYGMDPAQFHAYCFGFHWVQDAVSGKIYTQSLNYNDDAGSPLRWMRRAPHIMTEGHRKRFYRRFELLMNTGGQTTPAAPVCNLRWSNDGGATWSSSYAASAGAPGEYSRRVIWRQLGAGRSRVFEVSGADTLPNLSLIGAELRLEEGLS